jgi:hypothetical protein
MTSGGSNPFIDPAGYEAYVSERAFRKKWEKQTQTPPAGGR